jgi:hypothetical protein
VFLHLDNESNFLIAMSSLFHSLTVEGINDELVIESLQKETIKLSPFRKEYNSSFIPSTVKEWNKLDIAIRKLDSLSKFKNVIRLNSQSNKICFQTLLLWPKKVKRDPNTNYII